MHKKKRNRVIMVLLCIAALLIILWLVLGHGKKNVPAPGPHQTASAHAHIDTAKAPGEAALSEKPAPSRAAKKPRPRGPVKTKADTAQSGATSPMVPESTMVDTEETIVDECENDTLPPWVYTDPSGGLHHKALSVKLFATKPCAIQWKTDSAAAWKDYAGEEILIGVTTRLLLFARDSCGNEMAPREEVYEITPEETQKLCPENMEHIKIGGGTSFCMDKYEWPNKKGVLPRSYVSVYQAMDTCAAAGKRLCTADEWTIACTGPYGWKYPYGASYELYACVTNDTTARKSGSKSECRGYFDVYDMSGNLAEWTCTRSNKNRQFYDVMGGFWESGEQSGCYDVRYSYFPQNRHNPVGFRCCKDAAPQ